MRYYRIEIGGDTPAVYTSQVNGAPDPGALLVEMDIPVTAFATPAGNALVRVWGISLRTIGQASDFNGKPIKVFGGMQSGLPLANPTQAGLLIQGTIWQAFGNWIGSNMTLDMIIRPEAINIAAPVKNIVFNWLPGEPIGDAIQAALAPAFPGYTFDIALSGNYALNQDEPGYYETLTQFASYLKTMSAANASGRGIDIVITQTTIRIFDGSSSAAPKQIAFTDLIGQPTWIGPAEVQFNAVMRADIGVGTRIQFPQTVVTTTAASLAPYRDKSAFQGVFTVTFVRHVGNSRAPDAQSWVSTFNAYPSGAA